MSRPIQQDDIQDELSSQKLQWFQEIGSNRVCKAKNRRDAAVLLGCTKAQIGNRTASNQDAEFVKAKPTTNA